MNRELSDLLEAASGDVREIDFAARAWAGARHRRRRTGRRLVAGAAVAAVVAAGAAGFAARGTTDAVPADRSPSITTVPAAWRVAPDGTQYMVAPAMGTEASLPADGFPGLDRVDPRGPRRELSDLVANDPSWQSEVPVAILVEAVGARSYADATTFQPVFVRVGGGLVTSAVRLQTVRDAIGNRAAPPAAASTALRVVAFPQPGQVVVLDLRTGTVRTYPVPSQTIERVRWSGTKVVVSGAREAWSVDTATSSPTALKLPAGYFGARHVIAVDSSGHPAVTTWEADGFKKVTTPLTAPVFDVGETKSSDQVAASGVFLDDGLRDPDGGPHYQGLLAVPLSDPKGRRLLVMGERPPRNKGCCEVIGFDDKGNVLYTSVTPEGVWWLKWNPSSGAVRRAFLLEIDPTAPARRIFDFRSSS